MVAPAGCRLDGERDGVRRRLFRSELPRRPEGGSAPPEGRRCRRPCSRRVGLQPELEPRRTPVCGIAGIIRWDGQPVREDEIRAMCGVIAHRGPDDEGVYVGDGVAIGMRRLSIIDLDNGYQPISNEDGTVWIVFNGEIYNYQELRRDLQKRGHTFRTA